MVKNFESWTEWDPDQKSYLTYEGDLPSALFRYRSVTSTTLDRLIDFEIAQEGIFLSALKDLNDPDEARFSVRFAGSDESILAYFWPGIRQSQPFLSDEAVMGIARKNLQMLKSNGFVPPDQVIHEMRYALMHQLRVACFTTSSTNFSMWANYAKYGSADGESVEHAGICIEYHCDESWRSVALHPVRYSDEISVINPIDRNEEAFAKTLYLKSREWRGEDEWRISSVLQAVPPFEENWQDNCKVLLQGAVATVIFGMNAPQKMMEKFVARVSRVRPDIGFKQVVRNPLTWVREALPLDTANF